MMNSEFLTSNPYGSARFASEIEAQALSRGHGIAATIGNSVIRFPDQEPTIIFGGAGSGKFSQLGAYQLSHDSTDSFFALDIGGQYRSTSWHYNLAQSRSAYAFNPFGTGAYSDINHPLDLWAIIKDNDSLYANTNKVTEMAIVDAKNEGENSWVGQGARRWLSRILILIVLFEGRVTPARLWAVLNEIDSDDEALKSYGRSAIGMPHEVYPTLIEMYRKKSMGDKEYGTFFSRLREDLDWLSSPQVAASVSGDEDYLSYLGDPLKKVGIYYNIPGGTAKNNESLTRMVTGIAQEHCVTAGKGARPLFYLEECAALGAAEFIKSAVSEYRKYFRTVLVYQSYGQLTHHFGRSGAQEIMDSCGMQLYLGGGIRDIDSARRLADTIGKATIDVDDPLVQQDRAFRARELESKVLTEDADPYLTRMKVEHEYAQSQQQRKIGRYAIDPAEILKTKDGIFVVTPGSGVPPVYAQKLPPYWTNPAMAGRYGPDPLFPPLDRVKTKGRFFSRTRRFITKDVPLHLAHMPNHSNGKISYVRGYKTWNTAAGLVKSAGFGIKNQFQKRMNRES